MNDPHDIASQVSGESARGAGIDPTTLGTGGGTIFTEPVLVVNQKAKLIEVTNQYSVFSKDGVQIASVNEVGQSKVKKLLRIVSSVDQFLTHTLEVRDAAGALALTIVRPRKLLKSTVIVSDGGGAEIGRIVQQNAIGEDPLRPRGRRSGDRNAQGRELARLELRHRRRERHGDRADHQDLRGDREGDVHHCRQLHRAAARRDRATAAQPRRCGRAVG